MKRMDCVCVLPAVLGVSASLLHAAPPVFNGAAVANGRLYLSLEDGTITCLGPHANRTR